LLKHKRLVSIIATLAFCLSFLAPALLAPAPAAAATSYITPMGAPTVSSGDYKYMGYLRITDKESPGSMIGSEITVYLPGGVKYAQTPVAGVVGVAAYADSFIQVPGAVGGDPNILDPGDIEIMPTSDTSKLVFQVKAPGTNIATGKASYVDVVFGTYAGAVLAQSLVNIGDTASSELKVTVLGNTSAINMGQVLVGKVASGATSVLCLDSPTVSEGTNRTLGTIDIRELQIASLTAKNDSIELVLPEYYTWNTGTTISYGGDSNFRANGAAGAALNSGSAVTNAMISTDSSGRSVLKFGIGAVSQTRAAFVSIAPIVDVASDAKDGDIVVTVKGNNPGLTQTTVTAGKKASYNVTIEGLTTKEAVTGKTAQDIGKFRIKESIAGSILPNRTITLTLPSNCKWNALADIPTATLKSGSMPGWTAPGKLEDNDRKITFTTAGVSTTAATFEFDAGKIRVAADAAEGDIIITVGGTAGVAGEVNVGTIAKTITATADKPAVIIGSQGQAAGDITIKETRAEGIMAKTSAGDARYIVLELPVGVTFAQLPKVTVAEGDIKLDVENVDYGHPVAYPNDKRYVQIPMKTGSTTASTIKISDIKYTLDRTVPEGDIKVAIKGNALDDVTTVAAGTPTVAAATVANAETKTPAPGDQGRSATFYIGSTIMNVNGANIIMDVAPYIKAGRTYVPVRYLGDALGATTSWDEATKTVTVTKDDKTVILVIGSKTAKVNGADVVMDVAPEIFNGRTMLPARWVAEGLGYQVGWNAVLQQVVIQ